ncbi:hypothetical protein Bhyg_11508 [Pseudolycoriella hygida]|uniref:Condensin-2 complex subunit H2 C-terminal domain-containing protein n=1 Tax=Pseudolycoriella hygida TaxID=35572 RepID=A0A9Q0MVP2_9DIPT|nr:hypothetical protein Bhyg_11508 [Pseudolycoriella hygida]
MVFKSTLAGLINMSGFDQNEKNRRMSPEQILHIFVEVERQHASKSYDFPVSNMLHQYMQSRIVPNFNEVATLIESAGKIYSRKVDYLESLLMAMHEKQSASNRTDKLENPENPDNPEEGDKAEKKRQPTKRLKNVDHEAVTIKFDPPKQIKKSTSTVEKIDLNTSDSSECDRFKNYCQAVKSKVPVFYERINWLISDKTSGHFDGARPISKDDPDCQKNYNVFVGCISFKEKQLMTQREFLNRVRFDHLDGVSDDINSIVPVAQELVNDSIDPAGNGFLEQSSIVAGDVTNQNETDLLESLRESSSMLNRTNDAVDDCDSAMVDDDASQLNSTAGASTIDTSLPLTSTEQNASLNSSLALNSSLNDSQLLNSTIGETPTLNDSMSQSTQMSNTTNDVGTTIESTLNESQMNSTQGTMDDNQTSLTNTTVNGDSQLNSTCADGTLATADESLRTTQNDSQLNSNCADGTLATGDESLRTTQNDSQLNSTCADGTLATADESLRTTQNDSQLNLNCSEGTFTLDPQDLLSSTEAKIVDETLGTTQNDSQLNSTCADPTQKTSCIDPRNIFGINEQYLKLNEAFRLPLSVLQKEVDIKLNLFGIPFGRLRRQVKFALPKDFDPMKMNKRTRDIDECSTTSARKFVKLTDGTATPSNELTATTEQAAPICDLSNVPESNTQPADTPLEVSPETLGMENGPTAESNVGVTLIQDNLGKPSELVDCATETQNSAINDVGISDCFTNADGVTMPKIPRIDSQCDAGSVFDSGIGTGTEESLVEGAITTRRVSLDLTPPTEEIEDEISAQEDEQLAYRLQEMTNLSEKVHSWHQRLKPILLHSEKRNDFDVRETSRNIVSSFSNCDNACDTLRGERIITFEKAMENQDKADTARFFFSMLQMANNGNIQIIVNHNDSSKLCPQDKITMKLLNPNLREIHPNIEKN